MTVAGVHGLLRFGESGNISSDTEIFNLGYNYALTRKDTIGMLYRFSAFHFPGDPQAIGDHAVQVVYGRKITGRLGLMLSGGPDVSTFRVAMVTSAKRASGTGSGSLMYAFRQSSIALSFTHGISSGSGVASGASTSLIGATGSRQLTRVWSSNLSFQYARNGQIVSAIGQASPSNDTWLAGGGLNRPLGRTANFSIGYQAQIQGASSAVCVGSNCATIKTAHQIFLSFEWHPRPLVLR